MLRSRQACNLSQVGILYRQIGKQSDTPVESEIKAHRTFQRKLETRLLLNPLRDALAVIIRIEKHRRPDHDPRE